jgi:DNA-binding LacI/PurR family transcriptional regulator
MTSLRDVAKRAGVSVATASRAMNNHPSVRPETRRRVEAAMRELLYVPPGGADETRLGAIGLLVPELSNPIFPALAEAIESRATAAGLATILCSRAGSDLREIDYVHMLLERRVDSMVFISGEAADLRADYAHYARFRHEGARFVLVNGSSDAIQAPSVGVDEQAAGQLATQHLIDLGHRRVGFVAGHAYYRPTQEKALGREYALRLAGLPAGAELVAHADFTVAGGRVALRRLLRRPPSERPTGVICSSDLMAIGALQEALAEGLRVPDDLSIVGFDGIEAARWTRPQLTTIEQPIDDIAESALRALEMIGDRPDRLPPDFRFRPQLRLGDSTAPPPGA